jgi:hypothetical protein
MGENLMSAKLKTITELEGERERLQTEVDQARHELTDYAPLLRQARAAAARANGDAPDLARAALEAEQHAAALKTRLERLSDALAVIGAELDQAHAAALEAERSAKERRLKAIRTEAGKLADALQDDLINRELWDRLGALYREHIQLRLALYGHDVLSRPASSPWDWAAPGEGLARLFASIRILAFREVRPPENPEMYRVATGHDWAPPVKTLREALGL